MNENKVKLNLCDYYTLKNLLESNHIHLTKSKGQNFLIDESIPKAIAAESGADKNSAVVEIGPGVGCLTQSLSEISGNVLSYEVDEELKPVLETTLTGLENVTVLFADALKRDFSEDIQKFMNSEKAIMCANLPYNITTPILTKAFKSGCFDYITVMIQKEVAERICAKSNTSDYGAFTILAQWYTEPEYLFTVNKECFLPQPKVTSAVVRMKVRKTKPFNTDEKVLFDIVRAAFNQRRKTLVNALDNYCGKELAKKALIEYGLNEQVRGEALNIESFVNLANFLSGYK